MQKLEDMAGKDMKLPKIKEPIDDILRSYDENNDGYLDKREFQGFARTYFSRMEWPLWKTAAKGAAKGVGFHYGCSIYRRANRGFVFAADLRVRATRDEKNHGGTNRKRQG